MTKPKQIIDDLTREPESAEAIRARKLVGRKMLIVSAGPNVCGKPIAFIRKKNGGKLFWFYVGLVVAEQLQNARLPVWATMRMVEGNKHAYYLLTFAETIHAKIQKQCATFSSYDAGPYLGFKPAVTAAK